MTAKRKLRFSEAAASAVLSPLSTSDLAIWELDTNANIGLGSFSKPASALVETVHEALAAVRSKRMANCKSDLLIKPRWWKGYRSGWQVWERRVNCSHRVETLGGSRMPKRGFGQGRTYIL